MDALAVGNGLTLKQCALIFAPCPFFSPVHSIAATKMNPRMEPMITGFVVTFVI